MSEDAPFAPGIPTPGDAPIGAFDSGYGGLTVLREIARLMPQEDTVFIGDSAYFPYGPKPLKDVRGRVMRICSHLAEMGCKLIVIACNTATAAGLKDAQREFGIPIIGVVEPGSRAAVYETHTRKVGVIATQGTVNSGAYVDAIQNLDAGIEVVQAATPELVDIAEKGIQYDSPERPVSDETMRRLRSSMLPMREEGIDTLVLGCTHFPLVTYLVEGLIGDDVTLVSSAEETAREVRGILFRQRQLKGVTNPTSSARGLQDPLIKGPFRSVAMQGNEDDVVEVGKRVFLTTSEDVKGFETFAMRVIGRVLAGYEPTFEHVRV